MLYARDNGGKYPPSLEILLAHDDLSASGMVCPSSNDEMATGTDTAGIVTEISAAETNTAGHKHCLSYVYTGRGLNVATVLPTTVVAYEPLDDHDGDGLNVLFGDGHTEWLGKQEWLKVAAAAGVRVASSLPTQP